ncbi:hypothetical protein PVAP13_2KG342600 [Panicum virgatum]|uniref:Uncharacterized protein n=1 Tax=Panicum virgatum TaxID=38727 RepID=A0A8T0W5E1_PANVG|nr:hypothetical protein PVAP13_2KG342600 [Panicum virgatum]
METRVLVQTLETLTDTTASPSEGAGQIWEQFAYRHPPSPHLACEFCKKKNPSIRYPHGAVTPPFCPSSPPFVTSVCFSPPSPPIDAQEVPPPSMPALGIRRPPTATPAPPVSISISGAALRSPTAPPPSDCPTAPPPSDCPTAPPPWTRRPILRAAECILFKFQFLKARQIA